MEQGNLKETIAANLSAFRKSAGLTQAELAEQLNYSDKAVSKWERGESLPDVPTLVQISQVLGVPVQALLQSPGAEPAPAPAAVPEKKRRANKNVIVGLSMLLVWFVALLTYVVLHYCHVPGAWLAFVAAVPVTAIVVLSLRSAFRDFRHNRLLISIIAWGCLLTFFCSFWQFTGLTLWCVFLLGIPGQAAIVLWFRLFK